MNWKYYVSTVYQADVVEDQAKGLLGCKVAMESVNRSRAVVAFARCEEYRTDVIETALEKLLAEAPPPDVLGKTVLLKPNVVAPKKPESAACTHPAVVAGVVKAFYKRGATNVVVGDSPMNVAGGLAAKVAGIYEAVIEAGGVWVDFEGQREIALPMGGRVTRSVIVTEQYRSSDVLVTIPKLKTHRLMAYTGGMKNMFGLLVGTDKSRVHYRFPDKKDFAVFLTDLNIACPAHYAIMDGVLAMAGEDGPTNGIPTPVGVLAASSNVLALDWMCAALVGYDPQSIENLADAMSRNLWLASPDEIVLRGDCFEELKPAHFSIARHVRVGSVAVPDNESQLRVTYRRIGAWLKRRLPLVYHVISYAVGTWPHFSRERCIRCGACLSLCPARALTLKGKRISLERHKCIRCFCCHEICPKGAVKIRRGL